MGAHVYAPRVTTVCWLSTTNCGMTRTSISTICWSTTWSVIMKSAPCALHFNLATFRTTMCETSCTRTSEFPFRSRWHFPPAFDCLGQHSFHPLGSCWPFLSQTSSFCLSANGCSAHPSSAVCARAGCVVVFSEGPPMKSNSSISSCKCTPSGSSSCFSG